MLNNSQTKRTADLRFRRKRWLLVALVFGLPLGGVVGAFAIAPSTSLDSVDVRRVSESLSMAPVPVTNARDSSLFWREERIARGDSIVSLLSRLGVDDAVAARHLSSNEIVRASVRANSGRIAAAHIADDGVLQELQLRGESALIEIRRSGDTFSVSKRDAVLSTRVDVRSGRVTSSLFSAMDEADVPDAIASDFADIFASEVDLHKELHRGDRFSIVYEMIYSGEDLIRSGRILAAEFTSQGKTRQAIYFHDPATGRGDYFSPSGRSMKRAFLRSPLEFSRITSGFSNARLHPVLQVWRAHKGIDYAAPIGSRVRATGEGVVSLVGVQSGYGRVVTVKHAGGYSTLYGHLSGVARDVHVGKHIQQGEVLGFVGMSGLATGPHLHYEFHVNGVHADPTRVAPEQGPIITAALRPTFEDVVGARLRAISMIRGLNVASKE